MKKHFLLLCLICVVAFAKAQNGLEQIIVEKYYVSDANDTNANSVGGVLPIGSVTYRIYADMLPGYKFQAGYGVAGHELRIATTTLFFNNEDRGATTPTFNRNQAKSNTIMLDSWLSVGGACSNNYGILKSHDDGVATLVNTYSPQVLQNADTAAGIPLTTQDGFIAGIPEQVTLVGISNEVAVFDNQNDGTNGPLFSTYNGSWASLNGSVGPDTVDNKVLIAQITTDGVLSFELNIQIGTPVPGVSQNYVARNPVANEITIPSLIYPQSVGIANNNSPIADFRIYPNPVSNYFTMEITPSSKSNKNSYVIYDLNGRVITVKKLGTINTKYLETVDVSTFPQGQYLVELTVDGISTARKFTKK